MYQVLEIRKVKTVGGLKNVLGHNSREIISKETRKRLNPNWETDWADIKDIHLLGKSWASALDDRKRLCEDLRRKVNKNASAGIEFVISAGEGFARDKWKDYLYDAKAFFEKKFGADNLISFAIHLDETTPHAHLAFVPIVTNPDKTRRYAAASILGGPRGMTKLHTEFWEAVGRHYGLERGEQGRAVTHSDAKDFRRKVARLDKKELELTKKEETLLFEEGKVNRERLDIKTEVAKQVTVENTRLQQQWKEQTDRTNAAYHKKYDDASAQLHKNYDDALAKWSSYVPSNLANYDRVMNFCTSTSHGDWETELENRKLTKGLIDELRKIIYALQQKQHNVTKTQHIGIER